MTRLFTTYRQSRVCYIFFLATLCLVLLRVELFNNLSLNLGFVILNHASRTGSSAELLAKNRAFFQRAATAPDTLASANWGLGLVALQLSDEAEAAQRWRAGNIPVDDLLKKGDIAFGFRDLDTALSWYQCAFLLDFPAAADSYARALHESGNHQDAIEIWVVALNDHPGHPQRLRWWQGYADSLAALQLWDTLAKVLGKAILEFPNDAVLLTRFAEARYQLNGQIDEAIRLITEVIESENAYARAYAVMASILAKEDRFAESADWYRLASERDPSVKWWLVARANALRDSGNLEESELLYSDSIAKFPDYHPAYFGLAWLYRLKNNPDAAVKASKRALELEGAFSVAYLLQAGDIYLWAGQLNSAIAAYESALELAPENTRIRETLARIRSSDE